MSKKNLVLIVIDSLRKDFVGAYGNSWIQTPHLDAFFGDSIKFTNAYPESMPTIPFRRSLLTGKRTFPFRNWKPFKAFYPLTKFGNKSFPQGWTPIPDDDITLADYLSDLGYNCALVTDCFHQHYPGMNFHRGYHTWEFVRGQEYDLWKNDTLRQSERISEDFLTENMRIANRKPWELGRYLINNDYREYEEQYFPAQVFRAAANWLDKNYQKEGFFLSIDCFDPHEPWDPPQHYRDLYDPGYTGREVLIPLYTPNYKNYLTEEELRHMRALYAGECTMVDFWFGFFLSKLRMLGLDKNTLIVVISDHGHQLGEKGYTGKVQRGLLPCLVDLVLGIRHPDRVGSGQECDHFVLNHDILPTVLAFLGEEAPEPSEGVNLWPMITGAQEPERRWISTCYKEYFLVKDDQFSLIADSQKTDTQLFNHKEDPDHTVDISRQHPEKVADMWSKLVKDADGDIPITDYHDTVLVSGK